MLVNNLTMRLKNRSAEEVEKARNLLLSLEGKVPGLLGISVEIDARGPDRASFDLMLITKFASLDDYAAYLDHPAHVEVSGQITPLVENGASLLYET